MADSHSDDLLWRVRSHGYTASARPWRCPAGDALRLAFDRLMGLEQHVERADPGLLSETHTFYKAGAATTATEAWKYKTP
jgi:hypothetical protein